MQLAVLDRWPTRSSELFRAAIRGTDREPVRRASVAAVAPSASTGHHAHHASTSDAADQPATDKSASAPANADNLHNFIREAANHQLRSVMRRVVMSRTSRVGCVVALSLGLLLAGSGAAAAGTKTVPPKTWASSVCQDFTRWQGQLTKLGSTASPSDPAAGKAAITKFLGGALKATDKLAKDLKSAGVPSINNGNAIATAFMNAVKSLRSAYATANTNAAALSTTDAAAFALSAQAMVKGLQTAGTTLQTTLAAAAKQYPASALNQAFTSTKACRA